MRSRTYCFILLLPIIALSVIAFATMFYIQPNFSGDLTRIGGYTNRAFGWNTPQQITATNNVKMARDLADDGNYYDVVVLGDSFSQFAPPRLNRWQQIFASATGTSLVTYHFNQVWLDDYLSSTAFKNHPPKILVMEFVERNIETFVKAHRSAECDPDSLTDDRIALHLPNNFVPMLPLLRPTGIASLEEAMNFLRINLKSTRKVIRYPLNSDKLFSNRASNQLLALRDDQLKYGVATADVEKLGCYFRERQQRAEANGVTHFVVMVPPDKTTLYCPYIHDRANKRCDNVMHHVFVPGLHALKLDEVFADALDRGVVDLYLPNDTHWGYRGSELAANALREWLGSAR